MKEKQEKEINQARQEKQLVVTNVVQHVKSVGGYANTQVRLRLYDAQFASCKVLLDIQKVAGNTLAAYVIWSSYGRI